VYFSRESGRDLNPVKWVLKGLKRVKHGRIRLFCQAFTPRFTSSALGASAVNSRRKLVNCYFLGRDQPPFRTPLLNPKYQFQKVTKNPNFQCPKATKNVTGVDI